MRLQLAGPDQRLLGPEQYNELFSMHGTRMIFWYAFPVLSGFSNYFWPLLLGARNMAFPRLNPFSYWVFLASGIFLYCSFAVGAAPNDGWFNYPPYGSHEFNPGPNIDFYLLGLIFFGASLTAGGINFVVTTLRTRAQGVDKPLSDRYRGHVERQCGWPAGGAYRERCLLPAVDGPAVRDAFLQRSGGRSAAVVAAPVLDVRASLGLHDRIAGDGHRVGCAAGVLPWAARRLHRRRIVDGRHDDDRLWRVGAPHVRHRTTRAGCVVLCRDLDPDFVAERRSGVLLAGDDLDRPTGIHSGLSFPRWFHRPVRDRRRVRLCNQLGAGQLGTDRHLLGRRPYPLRAYRHQPISGHCRGLLLVPEDHRPDAQRAAGQMEFLGDVRRVQSRFLPDALHRAARYAAADLHLSGWDWLDDPQSDNDNWRIHSGRRHPDVLYQCRRQSAPRPGCRTQPVGCALPGMGDLLATVAL
ncbi:MAG: cbb3-type cytochrome c oxidase subunit I [Acetobacteraceae bacterium]|nr:cbb3-type cytochrome c oxidase subunit I [Acetobacteraceae bacterium]